GGAAPYTYTLAGGSLPPGMTLDPGGSIQGTATQLGTFTFTVQVADAAQSAGQKQLSLIVVLPLQISTGSLPASGAGASYSQTLGASGGPPPYTWAVESGSLPAGLALDGATGAISGTPTAAGSSTFGILLTDKGSQQVHKSLTISVTSPVSITTGNLSGLAG